MSHEPFSRSPVDIIIPFHGLYGKVTKLVESILFATKSNPYQICLVDDCSPNEKYVEQLQKAPQILTLRTPEQLGFGGALQYGFERTQQPWVVFLHSDCVVDDPGWLIEMGKSLMRWRNEGKPVKMVAARTNNPVGGPQCLKSPTRATGKDEILEEGHLPLYCVMCHRDLFPNIGGFVKNYPYAWYEDEELAARMRKRGFLQGVCGRSWVKHHGGLTIEELWRKNPKAKEIMEANRDRCLLDMQLLR
jgi:GT2 family glycosyltransferase